MVSDTGSMPRVDWRGFGKGKTLERLQKTFSSIPIRKQIGEINGL